MKNSTKKLLKRADDKLTLAIGTVGFYLGSAVLFYVWVRLMVSIIQSL